MNHRIRMVIVACLLLAVATSPAAQTTVAPSSPPQINREFPAFDERVWTLQRTGLMAKLAAQRLAQAPDDPETFEILIQASRFDDALRVMRRVVDTRPDRAARMFEIVSRNGFRVLGDDSRGYAARLQEIVDAAKAKLAGLPKEEAAAIARQVMAVEIQLARRPGGGGGLPWEDRLKAFIQEYHGTEAALLNEVDLLSRGRDMMQRLEALDAFARAHPGTVAGAKALFQKGFDLGHNVGMAGRTASAPVPDPTERFLQVIAIVKELESGSYPRCEFVERAPELVTQFYTPKATYSPENVDRMLDASRTFIREHLAPEGLDRINNGLAYFITARMADLYQRKGDATASVEGLLLDLEKGSANPESLRYLHALFYMRNPNGGANAVTENPELRQKAKDTLAALIAQGGDGLYPRKALATLAVLSFQLREYPAARDHFKKYVAAYPRSDYAWVAALRVGVSEEAAEDWNAALASYRAAAASYADVPVARVLGHAYAARAAEALGKFDQALIDDTAARDAWDADYGQEYSLYAMRPRAPNEPFVMQDDARVARRVLTERVTQLTRSASLPGGDLLERGRWLIEKRRQQDGIAALTDLQARYPQSAAASDARALLARARLDRALDLADVESPTRDDAAAIAALDALARDPAYGFGVCAAKIAKACLLLNRGASADADALMTEALTDWAIRRPLPAGSGAPREPSALDADIAAIRALVFRPTGDGIYTSVDAWSAFKQAAASPRPPFLIVNPDQVVKLPNGETIRVSLAARPLLTEASSPMRLWLDDAELATLERILVKLGGTKRGQPTSVMQPPNQPVGGSMSILTFWNKFFPARPGHWGGWMFETFPRIDQIEFLDAERTKANARVTIGYEGGTVVLEKDHGTWVAKAIVNRWIT